MLDVGLVGLARRGAKGAIDVADGLSDISKLVPVGVTRAGSLAIGRSVRDVYRRTGSWSARTGSR